MGYSESIAKDKIFYVFKKLHSKKRIQFKD